MNNYNGKYCITNKNVILYLWEVIKLIKRELYLNQIRPFMQTDLIKIIIGIRRSGKSTLMKQIIEELKDNGIDDSRIIYLNFEDYKIREYKDTDRLYNYLEKNVIDGTKTYIFLDEKQETENLVL